MLLRRRDGALGATPAEHPLSLARTGSNSRLALRTSGTIANVVFPTGIDRRDDLGTPTVSMFTTAWRITALE